MRLRERDLERILRDRDYWAHIAGEIIREAQTRRPGSSSPWPSFEGTASANSLAMPPSSEQRIMASEPQATDRQLIESMTKPRVTIPSQQTAELWKRQWQQGARRKEEVPVKKITIRRRMLESTGDR